jgi:fibro-slime domain-containing protein
VVPSNNALYLYTNASTAKPWAALRINTTTASLWSAVKSYYVVVTTTGCLPALSTSATPWNVYVSTAAPASAPTPTRDAVTTTAQTTLRTTVTLLTASQTGASGVAWAYNNGAVWTTVCSCPTLPCATAACSDPNLSFSVTVAGLSILTITNVPQYGAYTFRTIVSNPSGSTTSATLSTCLFLAPVPFTSPLFVQTPFGQTTSITQAINSTSSYASFTSVVWQYSSNSSAVPLVGSSYSVVSSSSSSTLTIAGPTTTYAGQAYKSVWSNGGCASAPATATSLFLCAAGVGGAHNPTFGTLPSVIASTGSLVTVRAGSIAGTGYAGIGYAQGGIWSLWSSSSGTFVDICTCASWATCSTAPCAGDPNWSATWGSSNFQLFVGNAAAYNGAIVQLVLTNACGETSAPASVTLCTDSLPTNLALTPSTSTYVAAGSASSVNFVANATGWVGCATPQFQWLYTNNLTALPVTGTGYYSVGAVSQFGTSYAQTLTITGFSGALNNLQVSVQVFCSACSAPRRASFLALYVCTAAPSFVSFPYVSGSTSAYASISATGAGGPSAGVAYPLSQATGFSWSNGTNTVCSCPDLSVGCPACSDSSWTAVYALSSTTLRVMSPLGPPSRNGTGVTYTVTMSNACGSTSASLVDPCLLPVPSLSVSPSVVTIGAAGGSAVFTATVATTTYVASTTAVTWYFYGNNSVVPANGYYSMYSVAGNTFVLNITGVTSAFAGIQYYALASNQCSATGRTGPVTVFVCGAAPVFSTVPIASYGGVLGSISGAVFGGSSFPTAYLWQMSSDGGATFSTVCSCPNVAAGCSGCTDPYAVLSVGSNGALLSNVPAYYAGYVFSVTLSNACGSTSATVVMPAYPTCTLSAPGYVASTTFPIVSAVAGTPVALSVSLSATSFASRSSLVYAWYYGANDTLVPLGAGNVYSSAVSSSNTTVLVVTLSIANATAAANGASFYVLASNGAGCSTAKSAVQTLSVCAGAPYFTVFPYVSGASNTSVTMTANGPNPTSLASLTPATGVIWSLSADGITFVPVWSCSLAGSCGSPSSTDPLNMISCSLNNFGQTSLTINYNGANGTSAYTGYTFSVQFTNACGASSPAVIPAPCTTPTPSLSTYSTNQAVAVGGSATFFVTVNPVTALGSLTVTWLFSNNNTAVPVIGNGYYSTTVSNATTGITFSLVVSGATQYMNNVLYTASVTNGGCGNPATRSFYVFVCAGPPSWTALPAVASATNTSVVVSYAAQTATSSSAAATSVIVALSTDGGNTFGNVCGPCNFATSSCVACYDPLLIISSWNQAQVTISPRPSLYAGYVIQVTFSNACGAGTPATLTLPTPVTCPTAVPSVSTPQTIFQAAAGSSVTLRANVSPATSLAYVSWVFVGNGSTVQSAVPSAVSALDTTGTIATLTFPSFPSWLSGTTMRAVFSQGNCALPSQNSGTFTVWSCTAVPTVTVAPYVSSASNTSVTVFANTPANPTAGFATGETWAMSLDGGSTFQTVCSCPFYATCTASGAPPACFDALNILTLTTTLQNSGVTITYNGVSGPANYANALFRVTFLNACGAAAANTSAPGSLCFQPQPAASIATVGSVYPAVGDSVSFAATLAPSLVTPSLTVTWAFSNHSLLDLVTPGTPFSVSPTTAGGASTLTITNAPAWLNGLSFGANYTNGCASRFITTATLTVCSGAPTVTTQPFVSGTPSKATVTVSVGVSTGATAASGVFWELLLPGQGAQWTTVCSCPSFQTCGFQRCTDPLGILTFGSSSLSFGSNGVSSATAYQGAQVRATYSNACGSVTTAALAPCLFPVAQFTNTDPLTAFTPVGGSLQVNATLTVGSLAPGFLATWYYGSNNTAVPVTNNGFYSASIVVLPGLTGNSVAILTVQNVQLFHEGEFYYVNITQTCTSAASVSYQIFTTACLAVNVGPSAAAALVQTWDAAGVGVTFSWNNGTMGCGPYCTAPPQWKWQYCVGTPGVPGGVYPGIPCVGNVYCATCQWFPLVAGSIPGLSFFGSPCGPGVQCGFTIANATKLYWYSFRLALDCNGGVAAFGVIANVSQTLQIPVYTVLPPNPNSLTSATGACPATAGIPSSRQLVLTMEVRDVCGGPQTYCNDPVTGYWIQNHIDYERSLACDGQGKIGGVPSWISGVWTPTSDNCGISVVNRYLDPVLGIPVINCSAVNIEYPGGNCVKTNSIGSGTPWYYAAALPAQSSFATWYVDDIRFSRRTSLSVPLAQQFDPLRGWLNSYYWNCQTFYPINDYMMGNYSSTVVPVSVNRNYAMACHVSNNFTYTGGEVFNFVGDDDVWVFINHQLAMDMGGLHVANTANLNLDAVASFVNITIGGTYQFDLFYNERHTVASDLAFATSIVFAQASCSPQPQSLVNAQCNGNLTIVLDASAYVTSGCCQGSGCASTAFLCQAIRNGIINLVNSAYQESKLGSPIYLSVIRFATTATLDFPMTLVTQSFVSQFTVWINANYLTGPTTLGTFSNWADAFQLAYSSNPAPKPNLLVMFAAGVATVSGPRHVPSCSAFGPTCAKQAPIDACSESNLFKQATNARVFFIQVGSLGGRTVSGSVIWDGQSQSFASSDYVTLGALSNVPAAFQSVAQSLCPCLTDQLCTGADCQTDFAAKFRLTESPSSNIFATNGVTQGYLYFSFNSNQQNVAYQIFNVPYASGQSFVTTTQITIQREDIVNPCSTERLVSCSGTCSSLRTAASLPRFFHDAADLAVAGGVAFNPTGTNCTEVYQHVNPAGTLASQVLYVFGRRDAQNRYMVCAATTIDGSVWEFFLNDGRTYGSYLGTPIQLPPGQLFTPSCGDGFCDAAEVSTMATCIQSTAAPCCPDCPSFYPQAGSTGFFCTSGGLTPGLAPICTMVGTLAPGQTNWCALPGICGPTSPVNAPYNFEKLSTAGCVASATCSQPLELVFLIDQQPTVSASTFTTIWKPFVSNLMAQFNSSVPTIRFQLAFPNGDGTAPYSAKPLLPVAVPQGQPPYALTSSQASLNNWLLQTPVVSGNTDFVGTAIAAIQQYWPLPPVVGAPPRILFIMIGGPDSPNPNLNVGYADLAFLARVRGVTIWTYAISAGASQTQLANNLATSYATQLTANTDADIVNSYQSIWGQLCSSNEQLCQGCGGYCACTGTCVCPSTCSSNPCNPSRCDPTNPVAGCVSTNFPCSAATFCAQAGVCQQNATTGNAQCLPPVAVNCNDGRFCTYDYCSAGQGCQNVPYSSSTPVTLAQLCPPPSSCFSPSCDPVQDKCVFTPIQYSAAAPFCNQPCQRFVIFLVVYFFAHRPS